MERCWEIMSSKGLCLIEVICYNKILPESRPYLIYKKKPHEYKILLEEVNRFKPDIIFISGWSNFHYSIIGQILRKNGVLVVGLSDTPYKGNWRQWMARLSSTFLLQSVFDYFWVCGERQKKLISFFNYPDAKIKTGLYSCDHSIFYPGNLNKKERFIFIGKKTAVKGWDILENAYQLYQSTVIKPWELKIVDGGNSTKKIHYENIPFLLKGADCLILPSRYEPWGMVIHEAVASGCALITSEVCGANESFLNVNQNGYLFSLSNPKDLANAMKKIHELSEDSLKKMKKYSYEISFSKSINQWEIEFRFFLSKIRAI